MGIEKLLGKFYYDPKEGFMGINNLYRKAKKKDKTVKMKDVEKWLKEQAVGQVHTRKSDKIEYSKPVRAQKRPQIHGLAADFEVAPGHLFFQQPETHDADKKIGRFHGQRV